MKQVINVLFIAVVLFGFGGVFYHMHQMESTTLDGWASADYMLGTENLSKFHDIGGTYQFDADHTLYKIDFFGRRSVVLAHTNEKEVVAYRESLLLNR